MVGLTIIHIFGFDTRSALPLAEKCGVAFQLTNILRDIREDRANGRIYLPAEDLARFGADLRKARRPLRPPDELRGRSAPAPTTTNPGRCSTWSHPRSRPSLWALIAIYRRLLSRIERSNYDVLAGASASPPGKSSPSLALRLFVRLDRVRPPHERGRKWQRKSPHHLGEKGESQRACSLPLHSLTKNAATSSV